MLRTSLRGEGKLHLGYVYGNEPGRSTAALMVQGALSFSDLLDRWLPGPVDWLAIRSEPFVYAVLADSMVPPDRLGEHYRWVDEAVAEQLGSGATYAGAQTFSRSEQLASPKVAGYSGDVVAAYRTSEVAVDPAALRRTLIAGLRSRGIPCLTSHMVRSVERTSQGLSVTATDPDGAVVTRNADVVVNCLWEGRLAVDAAMGIPAPRTCLYRLKYAVNATISRPPTQGLTTTFALGPYGDVVCWGDGRVYLSWYPVCRAGLDSGLQPPVSWQAALGGTDTTAAAREIAVQTVAALAERIEALRDVRIDSVTAGVVVAWGDSDIDEPGSDLHARHAIGVHDHDGYLSVDTGKLTTAPLFAAKVVGVLGSPKRRSF